ncbi:MAG: RpoL/Rpb11 RNA polymerase subunit family protein [Candidatus Thorarchaeota archaeon]
MAKKKPTKPEVEDEEDLDELEDELLEEDDLLSNYPKVSEDNKEDSSSIGEDEIETIEEEDIFELEEEPRFPDYKHLKLDLVRSLGEGDYELSVEGQSHGFCNILVKHLLKTEDVKAAAYKATGIVAPQIFIRLKDNTSLKIKDVLFKAIESLREEVLEVQKLFQKLM